MTIQEFERRVQSAKDLDFGDIFNKSIELFKKVWVQGLVMMLLTMVMMIPLYLIMYLPMIAAGFIDPSMFEYGYEPSIALMAPFYLFGIVFSFIAMVISLGMKAGFYRICRMKDLNEMGSEDYFYYFKKPYLGKVIKLGLITMAISLLAFLLCVIPIIYVAIPIALMNVIFAMNPELSVSEIVKAGFALGNKKWLITFGLIIISGLLAGIVGMLMCFIGIYITASFSYLPAYFIYKDSIGFDEPEEQKQIENI